MAKIETETEIVYTFEGVVITIKKDADFLDVRQKTDLNIIFPDGKTPQTWQDLATYLDKKL
jgi:hypothetical protein